MRHMSKFRLYVLPCILLVLILGFAVGLIVSKNVGNQNSATVFAVLDIITISVFVVEI